jgi:hypothetical protein
MLGSAGRRSGPPQKAVPTKKERKKPRDRQVRCPATTVARELLLFEFDVAYAAFYR